MTTSRTKCISTKVTDEEYACCARVARGRTVSEWARDVLIATAAIAPSFEHVVLAELLALRAIVLNVQFALANGETLTTDTMQRLIARADQDKVHKAHERLAGPRRRHP
jgi:hypothetical protein